MFAKFAQLFRKEAKDYQRDLNIFDHYVEVSAAYLSKQRGISVEAAKEFIRANLRKGGRFEFKDTRVEFLERGQNGDRELKWTTLSRYIGDAVRRGRIIAPTFTVYLNPKTELESLLAKYVDKNIKLRGLAKKAQFAAKAAKNKTVEAVKKIEQTGRKLANNAISGAHVTASTPLFNKTAHSTLTSTCRTTSGYGNANNEKFLSGNRHYYHSSVVLNNLATLAQNFDRAALQAVMQKYNLVYPSHEQVMSVIRYSTSLYWSDATHMATIEEYVKKLDPLECAAFCYIGDMWHLMRFNEGFMRDFLTRLSARVEGEHADPMSSLKDAPEPYINLAHQLCNAETRGIGKDYSKIEGTQAIKTLACTVDNIDAVLREHVDLIHALWMTNNVPSGVAHFPSSVRRSALASDTDSTIFTVQDWVMWYSGRPGFDPQSMGIYYSTVFLTSATITHVLALMSGNLGVVEEKKFRIEMKSEFSFDVFVTTQLGKHYFAAISCQEGNVFDKLEYEIKGVQLKNAAVPKSIVKDAQDLMKEIISTVMAEREIDLGAILQRVAVRENTIIADIRGGDVSYLRNSSIKDAGSYAGEKEESPYQYHYMWNEVFGPKYGEMPDPPYATKKISITVDTPTKLKAWVEAIEDKELADRLRAYLARNNKRMMSTVYLPTDILLVRGIPSEIEMVVDYDKIVIDLCGIYYVILEALGYYSLGDKVKRLISKSGHVFPELSLA